MSAVAFCNSMVDDAKVRSAVRRLTLVNFRNYKYLRLNLNMPFIILGGENGSGKTNVLEAVSFLSQGRGLRNAKLSEVKTFDFLASVVKEFEYNETKEVERRIVQVNNQKLSSQNELGNYLSVIWITPQMDRLFQGGSQLRRSFLDRIVYAFDVEHARRISAYDNLYKQWLQILKSGNINTSWLNALEEQMSGIGVAIAAARREQVQKLNTFIEQNPDDVFPDATLTLDGTIEQMLNDKPAIYVEDFYRESLFNQRRNILFNDSANTLNKTDLCVLYKQKNVPAALCSTGEQKSLLLSIILAHARSLLYSRGVSSILLLDEVAAHLDDTKKDAFLAKIQNMQLQTWLTTTDLSEFAHLREFAQFFEVKDNTVQEVSLSF